jgi:hypothetical protein
MEVRLTPLNRNASLLEILFVDVEVFSYS